MVVFLTHQRLALDGELLEAIFPVEHLLEVLVRQGELVVRVGHDLVNRLLRRFPLQNRGGGDKGVFQVRNPVICKFMMKESTSFTAAFRLTVGERCILHMHRVFPWTRSVHCSVNVSSPSTKNP